MDGNETQYPQYQEEQNFQRDQKIQNLKDKTYKFFYNIWPSVNRVLSFFLYHILRVVKGFIRIALEQFKLG